MTRHWTVSINGAQPVHLDLAQYIAAIERAKRDDERVDVTIIDAFLARSPRLRQ